jgi:thiamine-phosphate pyrophosphorylase
MQPLRARLQKCLLYLVTPARPAAGPLDWFVPLVLEAGVDIVQLREKDMEAGTLLPFCETVRRRTSELGALFVVNDRVDLALAAAADGVHLGQDDLPYIYARSQMGPDRLIGLSTHSPAQLDAVVTSGADYAAVGPIFETPTKPGRPAVGVEMAALASRTPQLPVFAIGGIDESNVEAVVAAGARRICVVRALTEADDPARVARRLKATLEGAAGSKV